MIYLFNKTLLTSTLKTHIYTLELINSKYYVGKTIKNVQTRFEQHLNIPIIGRIGRKGRTNKIISSAWTRLYPPIKIIDSFESVNKFDEDLQTKKMMDLYGIENVRGGSYCNIVLHDWQIKALNAELATCNNLCFCCGKSGHFAYACTNKQKFSK